jgi:hypothetical protein
MCDALVFRFAVAVLAAVPLVSSCDVCPGAPPQCPYNVTLTVVTPGGGMLTDVSATVSGKLLICSPTSAGAFCAGGGDGALHVEAPGFQPVDVDSRVTTTPAAKCGCPRFTREPSTVTLNPS